MQSTESTDSQVASAEQKQENAEQKEANPELAKAGFEVKTEDQAKKESTGTHHGILVSKGDYAFKAAALSENIKTKVEVARTLVPAAMSI